MGRQSLAYKKNKRWRQKSKNILAARLKAANKPKQDDGPSEVAVVEQTNFARK